MTDRTIDRRCRLVQRGGRLQSRDRALCHQRFESGDIDVEASPVERHVMVVGDQDRVGPEHAAQRHEDLAPPGCDRQVGEQALGLVVRPGQGIGKGEPGCDPWGR